MQSDGGGLYCAFKIYSFILRFYYKVAARECVFLVAVVRVTVIRKCGTPVNMWIPEKCKETILSIHSLNTTPQQLQIKKKKKGDWETERERLLSKRNSDECSLKKIPRSRFYICFCYYYIYDLIFQQKCFDSIERMFITHGCVWKEKTNSNLFPVYLFLLLC